MDGSYIGFVLPRELEVCVAGQALEGTAGILMSAGLDGRREGSELEVVMVEGRVSLESCTSATRGLGHRIFPFHQQEEVWSEGRYSDRLQGVVVGKSKLSPGCPIEQPRLGVWWVEGDGAPATDRLDQTLCNPPSPHRSAVRQHHSPTSLSDCISKLHSSPCDRVFFPNTTTLPK